VEDNNTLVKRLFGKSRKPSNASIPTEKHQHPPRTFSQVLHNPAATANSFDRSSRGSVAMSDQEQRRDAGASPTNIGRVTSANMSSTDSQRSDVYKDVFVMPPPQPNPPKRPIGEKIVRWLKYGPVDWWTSQNHIEENIHSLRILFSFEFFLGVVCISLGFSFSGDFYSILCPLHAINSWFLYLWIKILASAILSHMLIWERGHSDERLLYLY